MMGFMEEVFGEYKFLNVWKNVTPEIKKNIIEFWVRLRAMPPETKPEERVNQVVFVVMDKNENIAGICTSYPAFVRSLGFNMYYFRCLVHPDHRQFRLGSELLLRTRILLNEITNPNDVGECRGVLAEFENPIINKVHNEAVWPKGMIYIGNNNQGSPMRIGYFDGARI
ncbi:MAG: hypothetical protein GY816_20570 [Cytophagales bacterium]|nr:hypothetical protein [Cytophagales bacterium]